MSADSETALLQAVCDEIRERCGYLPDQCDVEFDADAMPPTAGEVYVVVMPGGWEPGPRNNSSGGILDEIIGVDVMVVLRAAGAPRDRKRSLFLDNLKGLNRRLWDIVTTVGQFNYNVLNRAKGFATGNSEGFIEPLKFAGMDTKPRLLGSDFFAARPGEKSAGLARTVRFRGARRIQTRTQMA